MEIPYNASVRADTGVTNQKLCRVCFTAAAADGTVRARLPI